MKTIKFVRAAIILIGILLSACAPSVNPSAPANVGGGKSLSDVIFTGVIESMSSNQWVINGQTIKVDSSVLRDGPFAVGDTVKVEASVAEDGSITAQRVEMPAAIDSVEVTSSTPQDFSAAPQAPVFDGSGNEAFGTVDAITETSITVGGQTYTFASGVEIKGDVAAGATVKLHFTVNADGTLSVREIEIADPTEMGEDNGNDDSSAHDVNDDHGGDNNSSDDGSNHDANDDHGGDSNHDSNDDNSGGNSGNGG